MKEVVIIPSNTDLNRGDQALVWESIRLVEEVYQKNDVKCYLMTDLNEPDSDLQNKQTAKLGYNFIDTIVKHPGRRFPHNKKDSKSYSILTLILWGLQAVIDYLFSRPLMSEHKIIRDLGEFFLSKEGKMSIQHIKNSDAIFVKGGGFIHSYGAITDPYFIYYFTSTLRIAQAYGKKVIMLPNSVGPLNNKIARQITIKTLLKCRLVTVREKISQDFLLSLGVDAKLFPDLGFYLTPSVSDFELYLRTSNVPLDHKKVIITLRPYRFQGFSNSSILFDNYITGIVRLVEHLVAKDYHVTFMAHTLGPSSHEDDRIAIVDVINQLPISLRSSITYIEDYNLNCRDLEKIYSYYDYMIGTRFHSVIFSLNVNVPSIAIAYGGNKGKGIMNVLGNDDYSIDIDKIDSDNLIKTFEKLEDNRQVYLSRLLKSRHDIIKRRSELVTLIRNVVEL